MTAAPDDDALSWDGDEPDAASPWSRARSSRRTSTATIDAAAGTSPDSAPQTPQFLLVVYGIFGGVGLLYTVGWVLVTNAWDALLSDPLQQFMATVGEWLAVASPALWALTSAVLFRRKPVALVIALVIGAIVVLPWPYVLGVGR